MKMYSDIMRANFLAIAAFVFCSIGGFAGESVVALTSPSADIEMAFTVTGRVAKISVREGQPVSRDEAVIGLDDAALRMRLRQLVLDSENDSEILAAAAEVAQKKQDLAKLEQAFEKGAATRIELEHGKLEVEIGEYRLQAAKHAKEIAGLKAREVEAEAREYVMNSPIDGTVERLDLEVGETAKSSEPAIRIVRLDPLWAETAAPLERYAEFAPGTAVAVRFPGGREASGTVIFRSAVADSASETIKVRLEIPNPENRHAGERITLLLDD
jgi:cobalt-zinc-cadmium efflux system membrane fusion protein